MSPKKLGDEQIYMVSGACLAVGRGFCSLREFIWRLPVKPPHLSLILSTYWACLTPALHHMFTPLGLFNQGHDNTWFLTFYHPRVALHLLHALFRLSLQGVLAQMTLWGRPKQTPTSEPWSNLMRIGGHPSAGWQKLSSSPVGCLSLMDHTQSPWRSMIASLALAKQYYF